MTRTNYTMYRQEEKLVEWCRGPEVANLITWAEGSQFKCVIADPDGVVVAEVQGKQPRQIIYQEDGKPLMYED